MEQYGKTLAATHKVTSRRMREPLSRRMPDNERRGRGVQFVDGICIGPGRVTPAGEWLIDNFHLIEEQIATAKRHLPRGTAASAAVASGPRPDCRECTTLRSKRFHTVMVWSTRSG